VNASYEEMCVRLSRLTVHKIWATQRSLINGLKEMERSCNGKMRGWATRREGACTTHYHSGREEEFSRALFLYKKKPRMKFNVSVSFNSEFVN
jgi:hypothetical protein